MPIHYAAIAAVTKFMSRLMPRNAGLHCRIGNALYNLGKKTEAIPSYITALRIKPDCAEAHINLGTIFNDLGNYREALYHYVKAFDLAPDRIDWHRASRILSMVSFRRYSRRLERFVLALLDQHTAVRPYQIVMPILGLLKLHPVLRQALQLSSAGRIPDSAPDICARLSNIPLFLRIIELCPIPDFDVESLLTGLRRFLLLRGDLVTDRASIAGFQASLALHCFTNEFVFDESEDETAAVASLEADIQGLLASGVALDPFRIACIASYRPLHRYAWSHDLTGPALLRRLYKRQVQEVLEETSLRPTIRCLKPIDDQVSQAVREQYEENPYPRWVNTRLLARPLTIPALLEVLALKPIDGLRNFSRRPDVLIAGCGSGQHSLGAASKFANSRVLAIDLSLSSLCHAIRKTRELGVSNITYMQADILDLGTLRKKFDVIESVGVLHHMADPLAGWKILVDCLKPGGLMKIGLYSELAMRPVIEARAIVSAMGLSGRVEDIRRFRRRAFNDNDGSGLRKLVAKSHDFYSTSACRDLYFHVQVHCFTIPQIGKALATLGLTFMGFELSWEGMKNRFEREHPAPDAAYSLDAWHEFETANPETFSGMYQFWVQKNG